MSQFWKKQPKTETEKQNQGLSSSTLVSDVLLEKQTTTKIQIKVDNTYFVDSDMHQHKWLSNLINIAAR